MKPSISAFCLWLSDYTPVIIEGLLLNQGFVSYQREIKVY